MKYCCLTRLTLSTIVSTLVLCLTQEGYGAQLPLSVQPAPAAFPDLYETSIAGLQAGLEQEHFTSVDLVTVSLALTCTSLYRWTNLDAIGVSREDRRGQPPGTSFAGSHRDQPDGVGNCSGAGH